VTTLLDPVAYPAETIAALYLERWSVELHFREIKMTLALDVLRCLIPAMIEKELLLHIIAYNLIRSLMQRAAILHCVELRRLSFKGTLDTLRHFADVVHASEGKPRKQAALLDSMLEIIAADHVPYRPFRNEPHAKKRRPKNYHLLTKPRHQMRVPSHRNRPKRGLS
jgi:Transposase DDE domain